jgi:hypothetical protein
MILIIKISIFIIKEGIGYMNILRALVFGIITCFLFNSGNASELQPIFVEMHQLVPAVTQINTTYAVGISENRLKISTEVYDSSDFFQKIYLNDSLIGFTFLSQNSEYPEEYLGTYQNLEVLSYFDEHNLIQQIIKFEGELEEILNKLKVDKNLIFGVLLLRLEYEDIIHNQFGEWKHFLRETNFHYPDLDTNVTTSYDMNIYSEMVEVRTSGQLSGNSHEYFNHIRYYYSDPDYPKDQNPPPMEVIQGKSFYVMDYSSFKIYILGSGRGWQYDVTFPLIQAICIKD